MEVKGEKQVAVLKKKKRRKKAMFTFFGLDKQSGFLTGAWIGVFLLRFCVDKKEEEVSLE